jgi:hypothetical protein
LTFSTVFIQVASGRRIGYPGSSNLAVCAMNKRIGLLLVVYSLLLAGLSYLVGHLIPGAGRATLIAGLAGGALCLIWGVRALAGGRGKVLPLLTLIPVSFAFLAQTLTIWGGGVQGGLTAPLVTTFLLVLSLAMLVRIAWSGLVFDVPKSEATKRA